MSIREWLRVPREYWRMVVAIVVAVVLAAGGVWLLRPAEYTSRLTMYIVPTPTSNPEGAYQAGQLAQQRIASYLDLIRSTRVSKDAARMLVPTEDPDQLRDRISASSSLESVIITVAVSDESPARAATIANAVGKAFTDLVGELESSDAIGGASALEVRLVEPATPPTSASSPGLLVTVLFGLLAGSLLGVGAAFARRSLVRSIKSGGELEDLTRVPNIGVITNDRPTRGEPLVVLTDPKSGRAEEFRQLRANVRNLRSRYSCKLILVTSPATAPDKTTTLLNLAITIASAGERVLVVEADLGEPRMNQFLETDIQAGLTDVLSGRVPHSQAVQPWRDGLLYWIPAGSSESDLSELLASQSTPHVLSEIREAFDVVLIDAPPVLSAADAATLAPFADCTLVVCPARRAAYGQIATAMKGLRAVSARPIATVLAMAPKSTVTVTTEGECSFTSEDAGVVDATPNSATAETRAWSNGPSQTAVDQLPELERSNGGPRRRAKQ